VVLMRQVGQMLISTIPEFAKLRLHIADADRGGKAILLEINSVTPTPAGVVTVNVAQGQSIGHVTLLVQDVTGPVLHSAVLYLGEKTKLVGPVGEVASIMAGPVTKAQEERGVATNYLSVVDTDSTSIIDDDNFHAVIRMRDNSWRMEEGSWSGSMVIKLDGPNHSGTRLVRLFEITPTEDRLIPSAEEEPMIPAMELAVREVLKATREKFGWYRD
jgi:hypothetical protein